jgi:DNA-binding GntR family transcriptional regulator
LEPVADSRFTLVTLGSYCHRVSIDHGSGEAIPNQLARILRDKITSGELAGRVPSIKTLSQQYGISHISVERALTILRDEDLIYTVIGKGSYVKRT